MVTGAAQGGLYPKKGCVCKLIFHLFQGLIFLPAFLLLALTPHRHHSLCFHFTNSPSPKKKKEKGAKSIHLYMFYVGSYIELMYTQSYIFVHGSGKYHLHYAYVPFLSPISSTDTRRKIIYVQYSYVFMYVYSMVGSPRL